MDAAEEADWVCHVRGCTKAFGHDLDPDDVDHDPDDFARDEE